MNQSSSSVKLCAIVLIILIFPLFLLANRIDMHIDHNRFLDEDGNTVHQLTYMIPNSQLTFSETEEGLLALVNTTITVIGGEGERRILQDFKQNIGVKDKNIASSDSHYLLDKISLTLNEEQSGLELELKFEDVESEAVFVWSKSLDNLGKKSLLSDLEFSSTIYKGIKHPGLEKFVRGDYEFFVDPSHIYPRGISDTLFIYYEIQNLFPAVDGSSYITEKLRIFNDDYSSEIESNIKIEGSSLDIIQRIPADTLATGYYQIEVNIYDHITKNSETVSDYFVISEKTFIGQSLFKDLEKEYHLLRYFLPSSRFKSWDSLSEEARWNFVDRFWAQNNPNPHSSENDFIRIIRDRIDYANQHFSYFKEGWETDLGRIYIRNGEPTEKEQNVTDSDTRLTRKEYEIWKYRNTNRVYLFIDIQGNGNYRLIYSTNDDLEKVVSNWERYLGDDFDQSKLE